MSRRFVLIATLTAVLGAVAIPHTLHAQESEADRAKEELKEEEEVPMLPRWVNFAILAAGLGYLAAKTLPAAFRERTAGIQKDISEAQAVKADAERRAAEMDARLKALGADIEAFKSEAASDMRQEAARIQQETTAQIARLQQQATVEVESATKRAQREIKEYAAGMALKLAEERLRGSMNSENNATLVDRFVADLERRGTNN